MMLFMVCLILVTYGSALYYLCKLNYLVKNVFFPVSWITFCSLLCIALFFIMPYFRHEGCSLVPVRPR